ncbi:HEAT repeat domain-containing protein [Streptomyces sp. NPDC002580]|uniref:HEAT repeat domain-containing protein n=1 Tax=Streptomyces sp. NPDC002580 TaxID=3364653 RepID=UPI0036909972
MDLVHPLDGLDARAWSSLSHAYGSAEDVPDLLRALAGADSDEADEALSELYGNVLHQGTVYAASAEAVPFLAGIAVAGHRTADLLALLGALAESQDEWGVATGAVRAAVAGQLPSLLPLLASPDPEVRRTAAWTVSHTRAATLALPALRTRWDEEPEPAVRAEILTGIARLDPEDGAVLAASVLEPSHPAGVRLAAVFAGLDAGVPSLFFGGDPRLQAGRESDPELCGAKRHSIVPECFVGGPCSVRPLLVLDVVLDHMERRSTA